MIKYKLKCERCEKDFESWFSSSLEFEKLKKKKLLNCHFCGSKRIAKTLMAPNIINQSLKTELEISNKKKTDYKKKNFRISKFHRKEF